MNRLAAGIVAFIVIAVIVIGAVVYFFFMRDDGSDSAGVVAEPVITVPVVRADAMVVPIRSSDLGMPSGGLVSDVLVRENDSVEEGQLLVRLDDTDALIAIDKARMALAAARADVDTLMIAIKKERELEDEVLPGKLEQARFALHNATERYLHLSGSNRIPGARVSAEGALLEAEYDKAVASAEKRVKDAEEALLRAMGVASTPAIPETAESRAYVSARDAEIAKTRLAIVDLQNALDDAQDLDELVEDAEDAIIIASALLENAKREVGVTADKASEANRVAWEAYEDAEFQWREVHSHYMGIENLTEEELNDTPDFLFEKWGADLHTLFDRNNLTFPDGNLADDPSTRWNELKLFGLLVLHPFPSTHLITCEGIDIPRGMRCIRQDYDDAWDAFIAARESYLITERSGVTAVDAAENKVISAQNQLDDAERAMELIESGRPKTNVASIQAELEAVNANLEALLDFPDQTEVVQAERELDVARAALADLEPDEEEIALAKQQMEDAEFLVSKLEAGRDRLDEERREARIAAAEIRVETSETALETAMLGLDDLELRAPFDGVIVALNVDAWEEVFPRQVVMSITDTSEWELLTVDLDELSVVHLAEGDTVRVSFDALPDLNMTGSVSKISRLGKEVQGAVTYAAEIRLSGTDPRLRWGMTASIRK